MAFLIAYFANIFREIFCNNWFIFSILIGKRIINYFFNDVKKINQILQNMSLNIFANYKKIHLVYNKPPIVFNFVIIITGTSTVFDTTY